MLDISKFPDLLERKIIIDFCNVCFCQQTDDGKAILANYYYLKNYLAIKLGISPENILTICDPGFEKKIDDPRKLRELIESGEVRRSTESADEFILGFALRLNPCFIISNDKYREHLDELPSEEWLDDRRVSIMFFNNMVCLVSNMNREKVKQLRNFAEESVQVVAHEEVELDAFKEEE